MNTFEDMVNEFNQPTNDANPTDMAPGQNQQTRYNASTGRISAMRSKTQRITRKDRMDLVNSRDMNVLLSQMDVSFKQILAAADNTGPVEQFVIAQLNAVKQRIIKRIEQEKKRQLKF